MSRGSGDKAKGLMSLMCRVHEFLDQYPSRG